ncbi:hypothetical protein B0H21DRAFT_764971 [Amylocystis lapponica]|nr:hypothetical protein B0H21DRAFT_764971 [Amylocystis lapponica]
MSLSLRCPLMFITSLGYSVSGFYGGFHIQWIIQHQTSTFLLSVNWTVQLPSSLSVDALQRDVGAVQAAWSKRTKHSCRSSGLSDGLRRCVAVVAPLSCRSGPTIWCYDECVAVVAATRYSCWERPGRRPAPRGRRRRFLGAWGCAVCECEERPHAARTVLRLLKLLLPSDGEGGWDED